VPYVNKDTERRRLLIFGSMEKSCTLEEVNASMKKSKEKLLCQEEFTMWTQYLFPLASNDQELYRNIVKLGHNLSDVTKTLSARAAKTSLS
tara:strand:+ start:220 stop:492 length:273 start_codon:yes stop_codon:yes gene_type:complete